MGTQRDHMADNAADHAESLRDARPAELEIPLSGPSFPEELEEFI